MQRGDGGMKGMSCTVSKTRWCGISVVEVTEPQEDVLESDGVSKLEFQMENIE